MKVAVFRLSAAPEKQCRTGELSALGAAHEKH